MSKTTDIHYDFEPANPDPGDDYDKWRERCLNAFTKSDERGWSLADHMLGLDEGGPAGPAIAAAGGAAAQLKAQHALRKRQKDSYALLTKHVLDAGHVSEMSNGHFQNGRTAWLYLEAACQTATQPDLTT